MAQPYSEDYYVEIIEEYIYHNMGDDTLDIPLNTITSKLVEREVNSLEPFDESIKCEIYDRIKNIIRARRIVLHNHFPMTFAYPN